MRERLATQEIVDAFTRLGSYSQQEIILLHEIARYLSNVVQNDQCISRQQQGSSPGGRLKDIMCEFSFAYTPLPIKQMLEKSQLISDGKRIGGASSYGRIYSSVFSGNEIVTKSPVHWSTTFINEHYISFRVINSILQHNLLTNHLVASFGIFVCPSNLPNKGDISPSKTLQICYSPKANGLTNKKPSMFIVQRSINGKTLDEYLKKNQVSLDDLQLYMRQIAITLIALEESPYRISHNDLHIANIMIEGKTASSPGHAVLIDWGMTRFVHPESGNVYQPFIYNEYVLARDHLPHTGAIDYFELLKHILYQTKTKNPTIYHFVQERFKAFSRLFSDETGKPISTFETFSTVPNYYLFRILKRIEKTMQLHQYHINRLRQLTYRFLFEAWMTPDDIEVKNRIVIQLQQPGFFTIPYLPQPIIEKEPVDVVDVVDFGDRVGKCKCVNHASKSPCQNKSKAGSDYCGKHQHCKERVQELPRFSPIRVAPRVSPVLVAPRVSPVLVAPRVSPVLVAPRVSPVRVPLAQHVEPRVAPIIGCTCIAILKSGLRKNQMCGKPCKRDQYCGYHS